MITFLPGYQFQASLYLNWLINDQSWREDNNEKICIISGSPKKSWRVDFNKDLIEFKFRITPGKILNRLVKLKRFDFIKNFDDNILRIPNTKVLENSRIIYGNAGYCLNSFKHLNYHNNKTKLYLDRACSHIITQERILDEEYKYFGLNFRKSNYIKNIHIKEYELADKIIVPSDKTYNSFIEQGIPKEKILKQSLFFNFKETNNKMPSKYSNNNEKIIVGFLGGSFVRKGLIYLLKAWNEIDNKNAILLIKSSKKSILWTNEIKKIIQKFDNIIFLEEYLNDISSFYKSIDIFCMPSVEEGFGMALIEAFYYNCSIISSDSIGSSELIINEKDVSIFKNRNFKDLANFLQMKVKLGKKKGTIRKNFNLKINNTSYIDLFK